MLYQIDREVLDQVYTLYLYNLGMLLMRVGIMLSLLLNLARYLESVRVLALRTSSTR